MPVAPPSGTADEQGLAEILRRQDGVVSRRQVLECGLRAHDIRRRLRRREWAGAGHPGVYVDHTGPLTWRQRAWAAVLYAWPAVLAGDSALRLVDGPGRRDRDDDGPIWVAIDRKRAVVERSGIVLLRRSRLSSRALWNTSPPRLRVEDAILDLASAASTDLTALGRLAAAVNARTTTADRLLEAMVSRPRIARREFLAGVLVDIRDGTCSVLEHGYLSHVERPHALPRPQRQAPTGVGRPGFRDVDYPDLGVVVELDGRLGHDGSVARDRDLERDLDAIVGARRVTVRLGWGQVFDRPCGTAAKLGRLLRHHGWTGSIRPCPRCGTPVEGTVPRSRATG